MTKTKPVKNSTHADSSAAIDSYENNPFFVATNGVKLLFNRAKSVGIAFVIVSGLAFLLSLLANRGNSGPKATYTKSSVSSSSADPSLTNIPLEYWIILTMIIVTVILVTFFISLVIRGTADYASAQLANNKTVTLREALRGLFANFWGYAWVIIVMQAKLFLWFLLFIIPGYVMSIRYSLTGVLYFDKQLKGVTASTHSAALTKGAWLTIHASHTLLNLITLKAIQPLLVPGTNAVLYRQLHAAGDKRPKAHILSWITLIVAIFVIVLIVLRFFESL